MDDVLAITDPATEKQINFLRILLVERIEDADKAVKAVEWLETHQLSKATASYKINEYLGKPKVRTAFKFDAVDELEIGMYRVDGEIFKVQQSRESGRLYAKKLTEDGFEYAAGAIRHIKASDRMTLEEAKEYGQMTGTCCNCGRTLTNEESIRDGIGPICAGKF